jgi:hypothetical protein
MTNGGFTDPGRPNQAEDGARDVAFHLADGNELKNPFLDILKAVMITGKNFSGLVNIVGVLAVDAPGEDR